MRRIATVLLAASFFGNLFGADKKKDEKPVPPPTTAVVETTEATEPPMTEEEFNAAMQDIPEGREAYGDKLVVRWSYWYGSDEITYKQDYLPEEYRTQNVDEVRGVVDIVEGYGYTEYSPNGVGYATTRRDQQTLAITILDQRTDGEAAFRLFKAPAPEVTTGKGVDYVDPQLVTDWIRQVWAEHMEMDQYHEKIDGYHADAFGGKIAVFDANRGMYISQYAPQDLLAQDASQVGARLFLNRSYDRELEENERSVRTLGAILTIYTPENNKVKQVEYAQTQFKADSTGTIDEKEVEAWVRENWDSAVKEGLVQVLNNYEPETEEPDAYDEMMMHGLLEMGSGTKVVCHSDMDDGKGLRYIRQYVPEELMARRPDQVGAILQITKVNFGFLAKLKPGDVNASYDDIIARKTFDTLDEKAIADWVETEWKNYLAAK